MKDPIAFPERHHTKLRNNIKLQFQWNYIPSITISIIGIFCGYPELVFFHKLKQKSVN